VSNIPPVRPCGLFLPGHEVHWIQALHSGNDLEHRPVRGHLLHVGDDGVVVVDLAGERLVLWNHDPDRLRSLVTHNGPLVSYQRRWGLLRSEHTGGSYAVCVTDADDPDRRPCPQHHLTDDQVEVPTSVDDLVEQLLKTGGFSVPGRLLRDLRR
jgi:hypothetical protein